MTDYTTLITSEHADKPNFIATVNLVANGIGDLTSVIQSIPALYDLDAAVGSQEDTVGLWVGQPRVVPNVLTLQYFGFSENGGAADGTQQPFGELGDASVGAPFYELGGAIGTTTLLNDTQYRTILRAAIIRNQYDGSLAQLEAALLDIFGVACPVIDPGVRSVVTIVPQAQSQVIQALVSNYDILPRPAAVRNTILFPVSPLSWTVAGSATASGTTAQKPSGSDIWDSSAVPGGAEPALYLGWTVPAVASLMGGLASSPSTSPSYPTLNFGLYPDASGTVQIFEAGTQIGTYGSYSAGDSFAVCFDGVNVVYLHNGQIVRVTQTSGSYSPMFCLASAGAEVQNVTLFAP